MTNKKRSTIRNKKAITIVFLVGLILLASITIAFLLSRKYHESKEQFITKVNEVVFVQKVIEDVLIEEYGYTAFPDSGITAQMKHNQKFPDFNKELTSKVSEFSQKVTDAKAIEVRLSKKDRIITKDIFDSLRKENEDLTTIINLNKSLESSLATTDFIESSASNSDPIGGLHFLSDEDIRRKTTETNTQTELLKKINNELTSIKNVNKKNEDRIVELESLNYFLFF